MIQPTIFIGHGSPMNAIEINDWSKTLQNLGLKLRANLPKQILVISAHWLTKGTELTFTDKKLETIYDFGGFPKELYEVQYPAFGSTKLTKNIQNLLDLSNESLNLNRGLDHGAWTVLKQLFPEADIPIVAMSIDIYKKPQEHFELAKKLQILRENGVLIIASGNIIHSFEYAKFSPEAEPEIWATDFEKVFLEKLQVRDFEPLLNFQQLQNYQKAINTLEHYYPLFYTLGTCYETDQLEIFYQSIDFASMSMLSFGFTNKP
jgi:4,5-DOPA dioxygenase extradiol